VNMTSPLKMLNCLYGPLTATSTLHDVPVITSDIDVMLVYQ